MLTALLLLMTQVSPEPILSKDVKTVMAAGFDPVSADGLAKLESLAADGDMSAIELLGEMYQGGMGGVKRDVAKACGYFEKSADHRADSSQNLAMCYFQGNGRPQDFAKARHYYRRAMDGGWPTAGCALGNLMIKGQGGLVDVKGGLALCKAAAEAGVADAQADYGIYLLTGAIMPKDVVAARRWLTAAAEQKQPNAAFLVAQIHWNGDGTPKDRPQAARWWHVAYEGGRQDAAFHLGIEALSRAIIETEGKKMLDGEVLNEAHRWLLIAAAKDPDAKRRAEAEKLFNDTNQIDDGGA